MEELEKQKLVFDRDFEGLGEVLDSGQLLRNWRFWLGLRCVS